MTDLQSTSRFNRLKFFSIAAGVLLLLCGTTRALAQTITHLDFAHADRASLLSAGWNYLAVTASAGTRNTEQSGALAVSYDQNLHPGIIRIPVGSGEIWQDANSSQNMLSLALPSSWTSIRLNITAFNPTGRDQEAGLLAYQNDDNYISVNRIFGSSGSVVEAFSEQSQITTSPQKIALNNSGNLVLRIDRNGNTYAGFYSTNSGSSWTQVATFTNPMSNPKLAIQVGGDSLGSNVTADLGWIEILAPSVAAPPTLTSISPTGGNQGQSLPVTIVGSNFQSGATCSFGVGISVSSCAFISSTQLTANLVISTSATAGTRSVTVNNPDGQSTSLGNAFTVVATAQPPAISGIAPNSGTQGQSLSVSISGSTFQNGATCGFGAGITVASCTFTSASQLSAALSVATTAATGARTVTVTNPDGQISTLSNGFTVLAALQPPSISSIVPNNGNQGQSLSVSISGNNFRNGITCGFGAGITITSCSLTSSSQLTASINIAANAAAGFRSVTVTNPDGQGATSSNAFSVRSPSTNVHLDFNYPDRASLLNAGWTYAGKTPTGSSRNTEQTGTLAVSYDQNLHPGTIRIPVGSGELWQDSNDSQNMLVQAPPANWNSIRLGIGAFNPTARDQEAGLMAYQDDDNYVIINRIFGTTGSVIELFSEQARTTTNPIKRTVNNIGNLILRLDRSTNTYTGYYSTDSGNSWIQVASLSNALTNPNFAIQVGGNSATSTPNADLAWVEILGPVSQGGPVVSLSSLNLSFGAQALGTTSPPQTVTLTNGGSASLSMTSITASGDYSQTNDCPSTILPGAHCSITARFAPTANGVRSGAVSILDSAPNSPQTIALNGTGKTLTSISLSPVNPTIAAAASQLFAATGIFSDGSSQDLTTSVTWNSSDTSIATISNTPGSQGLASAFNSGSTLIQAIQGTVNSSTTLNVSDPTLTVTPQIATLTGGQTQQFQASIKGSTWTVDNIAGGNDAIGIVSPSGLYTAPQGTGTHAVSASYNARTVSASAIVQNYPGVFTWHNDNGLTGQNLSEIALTPSNVSSSHFGVLFSNDVDGYLYAQPLYASNVTIPGIGIRNVVFVATEHNTVYAFDADGQAAPLWQVSFIQPPNGITTIPSTDTNCTDLVPEIGITGTPVIDSSTNTLYVLVRTKENGQYFARLHALDLGTGSEKSSSPANISATIPVTGGGTLSFDPLLSNQRPGLLLSGGKVYLAFASQCDNGPYHGWLLAYDATTLQQTAAFSTTPDGAEGGVWMSGASPAADASGNIFIISGNGTFDANSGGRNYGDSFIKLSGGLLAMDFFTPFNQDTLSVNDWDLGSSGAILLPDQVGPHPHVMLGAGKERPTRLYVVDRDNLGRYQPGGDGQIVQTIPGAFNSGLFSTAAYWNGNVYFAANHDVLKSYSIANGLLSSSPISQDSVALSFPGSTPAVSANGDRDAIVWTLERSTTAVLRAYDATDVSRILYSSNTAGATTAPAVKFAVPTIANGKVYIGTQNKLVVFGLK